MNDNIPDDADEIRTAQTARRIGHHDPTVEEPAAGTEDAEPLDDHLVSGEDADWIARQIGPQQVGGRYYSAYWGKAYEVLAIDDQTDSWGPWEITVRWDDGREHTHCTAWDPERDRVIAQPLVPDVTIVSTGRLHDAEESEHADILQHATIAIDLRFHFFSR
ncbi:hypothetical protein E4N62_24925 [Streptomyces sp. MNU76]|uniref:hypothetical protein n=1 Tax=Streptomyces sp. MNU76 TaxID=2560026 RepID=UPI001E5BCB3B|nr:hypothetical protein [Streptomyces sp. MNU76]MCC9708216.1 hypothetical protein [Streptomyces sp. MNU76]